MESTVRLKRTIFVLVAIVAVVFFSWFVNKYIVTPQAFGPKVDMTFVPDSGDIQIGEENTLNVLVNPKGDSRVSGVDLSLKAQGIQILDIESPVPVETGSPSVFTSLLSDVAADGSSARSASVLIESDEKLPAAVQVRVRYKGVTPGRCTVGIDTEKTQVVGNIEQNVYVISPVEEAVFNCQGAAEPAGPSVSASFDPESRTAGVGDAFSFDLVFETRNKRFGVSGFDASLGFDPALVEVVSIDEPVNKGGLAEPEEPSASPAPTIVAPTEVINTTPPESPEVPAPDGGTAPDGSPEEPPSDDPACTVTGECQAVAKKDVSFTKLIKEWDNDNGEMRLVYVVIGRDNQLPVRPAVKITLRGKTEGEGLVDIASAQVTGNVEGDVFAVSKSSAAYTIGEGVGPSPTTVPGEGLKLNLKLRFQGIRSKPKDKFNTLAVKCSLGDGGRAEPVSSTATFTADDGGIWSGTLDYQGVAPGEGYKVVCKGPKHLAKKVCVEAPTEEYPGSYGCDKGNITLTSENNFDFSNIVQLVGDVPEQDGWVTAFDIAAIRNNFGVTDESMLAVCDLNLDGSCNAIDHALIIAALEVKNDEQ